MKPECHQPMVEIGTGLRRPPVVGLPLALMSSEGQLAFLTEDTAAAGPHSGQPKAAEAGPLRGLLASSPSTAELRAT